MEKSASLLGRVWQGIKWFYTLPQSKLSFILDVLLFAFALWFFMDDVQAGNVGWSVAWRVLVAHNAALLLVPKRQVQSW